MIYLRYFDESFIEIDSDTEKELKQIRDQFSYEEKGSRYSYAYKCGYWSGKQYLISVNKNGVCAPYGLFLKIIKFCIDNKIKFSVDKKLRKSLNEPYSIKEIYNHLKQYRFFSEQEEITPRKDQYGATIRLCSRYRGVNDAPTGWGKSLAIFMQVLFLLNYAKLDKILLVVPTKDLVQQFKNDILDYCTNEQGRRESYHPVIQCLYAGQDKNLASNTQLFISTFQSINKLKKSFPNEFDCIILDEAHKASANTIKSIFQNAYLVKYKYGWTGSLEKESVNMLFAEAYIGLAKKIVTTKELIAEGTLANLDVNRICIQHQHKPDILKKKIEGETYLQKYNKEQEYFEYLDDRNNFICSFLQKFDSNSLLFFNHLKHGKILYDKCRRLYLDKKIFLVDGTQTIYNDKKYKTFVELKNLIETNNDCILIVSFGRFSTGINLKNLHNIFFLTHSKSFIRIVQSLGRSLRQNKSKDKKVNLFDFYDVFKTGQTFAKKHSEDRLDRYKEITNSISESGIIL